MSYEYDRERIKSLTEAIRAAGLRTFVAETGTYGFYTDTEGTRVVSFQADLGGLSLTGNYGYTANGAQTGTGWQIEGDVWEYPDFAATLATNPPQWATQGVEVRLATLQDHLDRYDRSSRYVEALA